MKEYQKALIIMQEDAKASSKQNKLVKLSVETEDMEFKEILQNLIKAYSLFIKPGWSRDFSDIPKEERTEWHVATSGQWRALVQKYKEIATQFVEERLASKKPQWQILAEKNGWAPKN